MKPVYYITTLKTSHMYLLHSFLYDILVSLIGLFIALKVFDPFTEDFYIIVTC